MNRCKTERNSIIITTAAIQDRKRRQDLSRVSMIINRHIIIQQLANGTKPGRPVRAPKLRKQYRETETRTMPHTAPTTAGIRATRAGMIILLIPRILVKNDPRDVMRLILLSRAVTRKMIQNLAWATGYNLLALPLAAGILAPAGFVLPMAVGAVVMSAGTVIVALNAQMLRRLDLSRLKGGKPAPALRSTSRLPA